ncbi:MAG: HAD superfamily (Subfamily IIIA) phosphatase, TIGR01668 [Clostridia bacterium 62_21]|nr:MAG: HAD superfamily (Subfamily IIIA) phosphatase, TIGR01668 [Clostridia bacterium 62_21]HAG07627.1 YqeG family HAD IIIA-type phosphatase [Peptococcaceae bacterium]
MLDLLYPRLYVPSLFDIDLGALQKKGINSLILDLDNTIMPRGARRIEQEVEAWLRRVREKGFRLCIVTNNRDRSVPELTQRLEIPVIIRAVKPRRKPFVRALELMDATGRETAVVGDQIFTDVLGGNRLGLYTILVDPLGGKEFIGTRFISRPLERLLLPRIKRRFGG